MIAVDVYFKTPKHEIDVYLNELTSETHLAAYNTLLLHAALSNMVMSSPMGNISSEFAISSALGDEICTNIQSGSNTMDLEAFANRIFLIKRIDKIGSSFGIKTNEMHLAFAQYMIGQESKMGLHTTDGIPNYYTYVFELPESLKLSSAIKTSTVLSTKTITAAPAMKMVTVLTESSHIFLDTDFTIGISSSLKGFSTERYRRFEDLGSATFNDIANMSMEEFTVINQ